MKGFDLILIPKWLADVGLWINRRYYRRLFEAQYRRKAQPPAWFDHRIDLYYHWPHNLFWLERGILPRKYMFPGCTVLDLFCGDGFYSRYFYSTIAGHIDAVDVDPTAIKHAQRWHASPKVDHYELDAVMQEFPRIHYDVIVWFEAIEHLNEGDYTVVLQRIKAAMGENSVLIGSTPIIEEAQLGQGSWQHSNEFTSVEQLRALLSRDFHDVQIELTIYPVLEGGERRTAYFTLMRPK